MRDVVSQDNFQFDGGSILNSEESVPVERDGYRTLDEQLQAFSEAGERLIENRKYEYQHDEDYLDTELSRLEENDADLVDMDNAVKNETKKNKLLEIEIEKKEEELKKKEEDEIAALRKKAEEYDKLNAGST